MTCSDEDRAQQIAALNDAARAKVGLFQTGNTGSGLVVFSQGIANVPAQVQAEICIRVRAFDDFNEGNDPYGEHDFGSVEVAGAGKVFWKFDYYSNDRQHLSEDPTDPSKTFRVLTIMLAEEY